MPIVLALGAGIIVADLLGYIPPVYWLFFLLIAAAFPTWWIFRPRAQRLRAVLGSGLVLLTVFAFGGWRMNAAYPPGQATFFAHHLQEGDLLSGKITSIRPGETNLRAEVTINALLKDSLGYFRVTGQVLLYLPPDERAAKLSAGDLLVFAGEPRLLRPPLNPGVFDLRAYWNRKGIHHNLFIREASDWRPAGSAGTGLRAVAEGWRRAWFKTFQQHLTGDRLAVAAALVMGKRDLISDEVKSAYTETGAVHVLAVSGLHVGIIFLILRFFMVTLFKLDHTRRGRIAVALLSVLCVWAFAMVSGLSPSVQRAAIMFSILALGGIGNLRSHVFNTLSAAAILMLIIDPGQLFQVGFQLSFTAIIGIVSFTSFFDRLVYWPLKILRGAWSAMAASTGAQLGTLPLALLYFKQFPTYFLVSGTIVILFAFATMFLGLLHGLVAGLLGIESVAGITGWLLSLVVGWQNSLIFFFGGLPGALLKPPYFDGVMAGLLALMIGLMAVFVRWRHKGVLLAAGLSCLAMLFWAGTQVQKQGKGAMATIFHRSRGSLIDVDNGKGRAWSFGTQPEAKDLAWTAGPRRAQRGYIPEATLSLTGRDTTLSEKIIRQSNRLLLGGTRWVVLDGKQPSPDSLNVSDVTHVLVVNGFKPTNLPEFTGEPPLLVVDGSTPFYQHDDWREYAGSQGLNIHFTAENGAFELTW
ncbi:MAG: ComEC/Rec2 family competence protein [Lewinella sp.]